MDLKDTYNKIADDWYQDRRTDSWHFPALNKFAALVAEVGDTVLDVGCGPGFKSQDLIERGLKVTGIDFSEKLIERARQHASQGEFKLMDIKDLPQLEQTFAGVFAQAVLLHVPKKDIPTTLQMLKDKLQPGGYLWVGVKEIRPGQADEQVVRQNNFGYDYERFFSFFTMDEVKVYLRDLGMSIVYENILADDRSNWIIVIARQAS